MTNRREFLQIGLAATALPAAGGLFSSGAEATVAPSVPTIPLYKVLFDDRFAQGKAFGDVASNLGLACHAMQAGDVTDFWYHDLDLAWRAEPKPIAGFTRHGPLFVLEHFGWDRGLRVVFRAEHHSLGGGVIEHRLSGPAESLSTAAALIPAGNDWVRLMAATVTQCAAGCSQPAERTVVTRGAASLPDDETFYSWVIAPKA
jgi:hypothetical protein